MKFRKVKLWCSIICRHKYKIGDICSCDIMILKSIFEPRSYKIPENIEFFPKLCMPANNNINVHDQKVFNKNFAVMH